MWLQQCTAAFKVKADGAAVSEAKFVGSALPGVTALGSSDQSAPAAAGQTEKREFRRQQQAGQADVIA
jgi:hypothetical protein